MSVSAIATEARITRGIATEIVHRLLETGHLEVRAVAHPSLSGVGAMAYATVWVDHTTQQVARAMASHAEIPFCAVDAASWAVSAEIRSGSVERIAEIITWIRSIPGVRQVQTLTYLNVLKDVAAPVGKQPPEPDETDQLIVAELQRDGRLPLVELARAVGCSATTARVRLARLRDSGALRVGAIVRKGDTLDRPALGVGIRLGGPGDEVLRHLHEAGDVLFVARTVGTFDVLATLRTAHLRRLSSTVEVIRALADVRSVETWVHLDIIKEQYAPVSSNIRSGGNSRLFSPGLIASRERDR